eukprot:2350745-Pyramimonas_sp.AAC.1
MPWRRLKSTRVALPASPSCPPTSAAHRNWFAEPVPGTSRGARTGHRAGWWSTDEWRSKRAPK